MPTNRRLGKTECLGNLGVVQPHEIAKLDHLGLEGIRHCQAVKRFMDGQYRLVGVFDRQRDMIQRHPFQMAPVPRSGLRAGSLNQEAAHGLGGGGKEVATIIPVLRASPDQPQPGLVDQRGGLEGVSGRFVGHLVRGQSAEFFVDEREQFLSGLGFALLHAVEYARDIAHDMA